MTGDKYTFLRVGEFQQRTIDVMVAACRRFGGEKAETAISACLDGLRAGDPFEKIRSDVLFETGGKVKITISDIAFVRRIIAAKHEIDRGLDQLYFAIKETNEELEVIDVK
jgi:hypothetical protein